MTIFISNAATQVLIMFQRANIYPKPSLRLVQSQKPSLFWSISRIRAKFLSPHTANRSNTFIFRWGIENSQLDMMKIVSRCPLRLYRGKNHDKPPFNIQLSAVQNNIAIYKSLSNICYWSCPHLNPLSLRWEWFANLERNLGRRRLWYGSITSIYPTRERIQTNIRHSTCREEALLKFHTCPGEMVFSVDKLSKG